MPKIKNLTFNNAVRIRIRRLYREKKMTMYQFTSRSGVPYSTLNSYINKKTDSLTLTTLHKICKGLGITLQDFFDDELFENLAKDERGFIKE